jgi:hypothetical protein
MGWLERGCCVEGLGWLEGAAEWLEDWGWAGPGRAVAGGSCCWELPDVTVQSYWGP